MKFLIPSLAVFLFALSVPVRSDEAEPDAERLVANLREIAAKLPDPGDGFLPFDEQLLRDELAYLVEDLSPENIQQRAPRFREICAVLLDTPVENVERRVVVLPPAPLASPAIAPPVPDAADQGMAPLTDSSGRRHGYVRLQRDAAGLECRLFKDRAGRRPMDVLMTTVVKVKFPKAEQLVKLRVRDFLKNKDRKGVEQMRGTETNYFICSPDLVAGLEERKVEVEFISDGRMYRAKLELDG